MMTGMFQKQTALAALQSSRGTGRKASNAMKENSTAASNDGQDIVSGRIFGDLSTVRGTITDATQSLEDATDTMAAVTINEAESREQTSILDLPPELYRELLTYMSPGQGVLLSITCKNLWARRYLRDNDCLRKHEETPRPERLRYLQLMGDDLPDHLFCYTCEKFEKRKSTAYEAAALGFPTRSLMCRDAACNVAQGAVEAGSSTAAALFIRRRVLESILRAATLGPEFGLSTAFLGRQLTWCTYGENALKVNLNLSGRVVQSPRKALPHLFIRTEQDFELDRYVDAAAQIQTSHIGACDHNSECEQQMVLAAFRNAEEGWETDSTRLSFSSTIERCGICPCDMQVHISRESSQCVFATIVLTCWRDLGPRGSHTTPIWEAASHKFRARRFHRGLNHANGTQDYVFGTQSLKELFEGAEK